MLLEVGIGDDQEAHVDGDLSHLRQLHAYPVPEDQGESFTFCCDATRCPFS